MKAYYTANPARPLFDGARRRARLANETCSLSVADIIVPTHCPALGILLERGGARSHNSPTLDRLHPELGYIKNNIAVISDLANRIKADATSEQVLAVGRWMQAQGL